MISPVRTRPHEVVQQSHMQFLEMLPKILAQARWALRYLRPERKEELIQEILVNSFFAFDRLVRRGKASIAYPTPLAKYAIRQIRAGRRIGRKPVFRDHSQFRAALAPDDLQWMEASSEDWIEVLADHRLTPVADQVAFRMDFAVWLRALKVRKRKLVKFLAIGNAPSEAAERFEISRARVSQLRSELHASWQAFQGEPLLSTPSVRNVPTTEAK